MDPNQVKVYKVILSMWIQLLLVLVACIMVLGLFGLTIYLVVNGQLQESIVTGILDGGLFAWTVQRVYKYYFRLPSDSKKE